MYCLLSTDQLAYNTDTFGFSGQMVFVTAQNATPLVYQPLGIYSQINIFWHAITNGQFIIKKAVKVVKKCMHVCVYKYTCTHICAYIHYI